MSGRDDNRPTIKKRGDTWHGYWRAVDDRPEHRESLRTKSRVEAEKAWHKKHAERVQGKASAPEELTIKAACDGYETLHVIPQELAAPHLITRYSLRAIAHFGAGALMTSIDVDKLKLYRNALEAKFGLCATSVNAHLIFIQTLCIFWHERGKKVPTFRGLGRRLKVLRKVSTLPPRTIESDAEQAALVDGLDAGASDALPVWLYCQWTATRKTEAISILKKDVSFLRRTITTRQKGDRERVVRITPQIEKLLRAEWDNHPTHVFSTICRRNRTVHKPNGDTVIERKGERYPFTRTTLHERWDDARRLVGIDLTWHATTRARFATVMVPRVGEIMAARLGGWESLQTLRRYVRPSVDDEIAAMEKMHEASPEPAPRRRLRAV